MKWNNNGAAMVIAMVIMAFIFGLGAAYITTTTTQEKLSDEAIEQATLMQSAQTALDIAKSYLFSMGTAQWTALLNASNANQYGFSSNLTAAPVNLSTSNFMANFQWWRNMGFNNNTYTFVAALTDNNDGDGNLLVDSDSVLKLQVWAYKTPAAGEDHKTARSKNLLVDSLVRYQIPYYEPTAAVVVGGSVKVFGSAQIKGTQGNVQANGNVEVAGAALIAQNVYATGSIVAPPGSIQGQPFPNYAPANIPSISPTKYAGIAGYILQPDGKVLNVASGPPTWAPPYMGWEFSGGNWVYNSGAANNGAFYAQVTDPANPQLGPHVSVSGSPNNWQVTIIAEGHVDISGSPKMAPFTQNVAVIAGTDLKIAGSAANPYTGLYAAHEQVKLTGTPKINGVMIAENKAEKDNFVGDATIDFDVVVGGNTDITYNGGMTTFLKDGDDYMKILGFRKSMRREP